jgi:hypothetical protein
VEVEEQDIFKVIQALMEVEVLEVGVVHKDLLVQVEQETHHQ